ncbi:S1C family serine protease [Streptomyces prunicolor]|uniref:S1C family serine protease n=1 Tax=Streptomyces prunicolor TaxID=67348 RepID=UPI003571762A
MPGFSAGGEVVDAGGDSKVGNSGLVSSPGGVPVDAGGDFELDHPAPVPPAGSVAVDTDGISESAHAGSAHPESAHPESVSPSGAEPASARAGFEPEPSVPGPPALPGAVLPAAERPKPLHDPDPYSTPPYGEPGPWAPAPPVQHPVVTSAPGVAAQAATAAPGTPVPPVPWTAPASSGVPVPSFADITPLGVSVPPVPRTAPASPGSLVPPVADSALPDVPVPPVTQTAPAPPAGVPALSFADAALPGAPASALADTPPSGTSALPIPGASTPGTSAPPVPTPTANTNPWHRYDPWAPPAPLQQTGTPTPTPEQHRARTRKLLVASAVALALLSGGVGGVVGAHLERDGVGGDVVLPQVGKADTGRAPDSVAGIAARALPSVVTLHVSGDAESGTGTGIVLDTRGHILTNNHVVELAGSGGAISVSFSGGQTAKGKVVGRDTGYDLAVVQVSGVRGLTPMPLGNSDNVRVGDPVVAIGAPFDLDNTVTSGIISATERPITAGGEASDGSDVSYVDALQTDAPINPGNSGGPLLDADGRLVGVNSAIRSADDGAGDGDGDGDGTESGQGGSIGLGFAIPVNQAKRVAEELINSGRATHPVIGVTLDMDYTGDGARVATKGGDDGPAVTAGGPGAKAGLKAGDVITEVDGERVHSGDELIVRTRAHRPGDQLRLTLDRDGKNLTVSLVLGSSTGG